MKNTLKTVIFFFAYLMFFAQANNSQPDRLHFLIDGKIKTTTWQIRDKKPKGIILISHGFSSQGSSLAHYAVPLAKAGYLVGAVTHADISNLQDGRPENDPMVVRQRHLHLLLATLKKGNNLNLPVGLLGYSLGGFSVLSATGYQTQFSKHPQYCLSAVGKMDKIICNPRFNARMKGLIKQSNIVRINASAVVLLAPAYLPLIKQAEHTPPILLAYSGKDEFIAPQLVNSFINSHNNIIFEEFTNAGHFAYLLPCQAQSAICKDPKPIDRGALQEVLTHKIIVFFDEHIGMKNIP